MSESAPETSHVASPEPPREDPLQPTVLQDLVALCKPSITGMNLLMALGGMAFAQHAVGSGESISLKVIVLLAVGSTLVVSSANTMNQVLEKESDKLMLRTAQRPLPCDRLSAAAASSFAILLGVISLLLLAEINLLTAGIALAAWLIYVLMYTPMKQQAPISLTVGAFAGAAPPLMGWTAVTGSIGLGGAVLFAILAIWQLPHFLAISLFRHDDYLRAGIKTVPAVRGDKIAKAQAVAWCTALLPLSLVLVWKDLAGPLYGTAAAALGLWFLVYSVIGLSSSVKPAWAKRFFFVSIAYLPLLTVALCLDVALL